MRATWDATGSAGDFFICATITPVDHLELQWSDNRRTEATSVVAGDVQGESWPNVIMNDFEDCELSSYDYRFV